MASKGTLLLTGANGGIATGFISQFLKSPHASQYKGYYTVRDPKSASTLQHALDPAASSSHEYEIEQLDMSTLESTRTGAAAINKRVAEGTLPRIRALILNAGVQDAKLDFTADGIERVFAVNYLHQFLLVLCLLQSMDAEWGRIVLIGSTSIFPDWWPNRAHYRSEEEKMAFTDVDEVAKGRRVVDGEFEAGQRRYGGSKVLMIMFMYELQRRLDADPALHNISFLGLDPGWVSTSISRNAPPMIQAVMKTFRYLAPIFNIIWPNHFLRTAAKTGDDLVRVCFEDTFGKYPKAVYVDGAEIGKRMNPEARDERKQRELWEGSLRYAGIGEGDTLLVDWK
ncbi:dehydrogenase/reductase [Venturia nashicola]|uniref:3beta-hydroxysteroid 3-dehydrogenase n=1 Tax=Venturia nashicola TaxID=86259 RepID=A0A4Z1PI47_9PEZI|nr:dehydrogenase/reductase [Venturia nashicola]TLD34622.1 dehydrogenase/reductase [Venturia nashicola]